MRFYFRVYLKPGTQVSIVHFAFVNDSDPHCSLISSVTIHFAMGSRSADNYTQLDMSTPI